MFKLEGWKKTTALGIGLFVVLVLATLAASALLVWAGTPSRSGVYAVFLTNGQAYFGNITKEDDHRLILKNIFYIQKNPDATQVQNDVTLFKLGNELHGPEDMMEINKSQVMFLERLKSDGKVMKAIQNYKK